MLPVVLVVMIITAAGGLVARAVYAAPDSSTPSTVVPNERAVPASQQPGPPEVMATSDAAKHPLHGTAHGLLQVYFDAINAKDYAKWRSVVSSKRAKNQPERDWRTAYRTTRDGSIVIQRIESGPADSARVLLSFTSVQDPQDAPLEMQVACIHWRVVFPLSVEDGEWKLDSGPTSAAPQHDRCG